MRLYEQECSIPLFRITQIIEPLEGGVMSKVEGMKTLYRGVPYPEIIYALGNVKNLFKNVLKLHLKHKWLLMCLLLPKYRKSAVSSLTDYCENAAHYLTSPVIGYPQNPFKWCQSGRELWRAGWNHPIWKIVCIVWEFDNAYRYRGQFMFWVINRKMFLLDPFKELDGVFKEMQRREVNEPMKKKYKIIFPLLYLLYIPKIKKLITDFVKELDFCKVIPDGQDKPYIDLDTSFDYV